MCSLLSLSVLVATSLSVVTVCAQPDVNSPVAAVSAPCSCSSGFIPVPVDVIIPVDPSNPGGLDTTNTRRLQSIFQIFGVLCEPVLTDYDLGRESFSFHHCEKFIIQPGTRCCSIAAAWTDVYDRVLGRDVGRIPKLFLYGTFLQ